MNLGVLSLGDVDTSCGPSPCGLLDWFSPSAECDTWQVCAATQNQQTAILTSSPAEGLCIVGGLDANGNTIVSCGATTGVDWTNPNAIVTSGVTLPSGDTYAGPPITVAQAIGITPGPAVIAQPSTQISAPLVLAGLALIAFVLVKR